MDLYQLSKVQTDRFDFFANVAKSCWICCENEINSFNVNTVIDKLAHLLSGVPGVHFAAKMLILDIWICFRLCLQRVALRRRAKRRDGPKSPVEWASLREKAPVLFCAHSTREFSTLMSSSSLELHSQ